MVIYSSMINKQVRGGLRYSLASLLSQECFEVILIKSKLKGSSSNAKKIKKRLKITFLI